MITALINAESIVSINTNGQNFKRGEAMADAGILNNSAIIFENDIIIDILPTKTASQKKFDRIIDAAGKSVLPGLIDCHTHSVFAGSRAHEFRLKLRGATYEEIAASGGGIAYTTKLTRNATEEELIDIGRKTLQHFTSLGVTAVEIKSGYGLNELDELKMLSAINKLRQESPIDIVATFLGAHIIPPEYKANREDYITLIQEKLLPKIAKENLAEFCDVFCEQSAYTAAEMKGILQKAISHGLLPRAHVEQFHSIGGLETALTLGAVSVDHLEVIDDYQACNFASTETVAVALPGCSFFLRCAYTPARKIIDSGGILAIASDFNPGSSHIQSLPLIMSIGALQLKMSVEEVLSAVTINAAKAINREKSLGSIEIGKKADFVILDSPEYADIIYSMGKNMTYMTIKSGKIIYHKDGDPFETN